MFGRVLCWLYIKFMATVVWVSLKIMPGWLLRWATHHYHGKVLTHSQAMHFVGHRHDHNHQDVGERVLPFAHARTFVLGAVEDIGVVECACRAAQSPHKRHCGPTQTCMIFGTKLVSALKGGVKLLSKQEALELLEDQHRRGNVHTAYFRSIQGLAALCNCCKCCCGGIKLMKESAIRTMAGSGFIADCDIDACIKCSTCLRVCPFDAIDIVNGDFTVNASKCMGCGVCVSKCPNKALSLKKSDEIDSLPI
jgi:Pyruvate/2-oxoacid:ferredoxin oxidoreductase delta subunit